MDLERVTASILSEWERYECAPGPDESPGSPADLLCSSPEMGYQVDSRDVQDLAFGCARKKAAAVAQRQSKTKMSTKRRMKASEREKMRMRSLAEALHQLREYLPPDYTKRGQPLTKIQTLKYTIEYINKLADILRCA